MINISSLNFSHKNRAPLFEGLELEVERGKIYGLLGLNGVGKSTLMKLVCGLKFPKSNSIKTNGFTPASRTPAFLEDTYYLPEELPESKESIQWYIKNIGRFYPRFDYLLMDKLLAEFVLNRSYKISTLSHGQKKKFFIAFALATQARLLLLDEPTNGLDIPSKSLFRKVIASSMSDDKCILISTHQVKDLENLIDHVTVLNEGKIIFDKSTDVIQQQYRFCDKIDDDNNVIYEEKNLGSSRYIMSNQNGEETRIDYELLFNGLTTHPINFNHN